MRLLLAPLHSDSPITTTRHFDDSGIRPMPRIPRRFSAYKRTRVYTQNSMPASLLKVRSTAENTWAQVNIKSGALMYYITQPEHKGQYLLDVDRPGVITATHSHFFELIDKVSFFIEFYCQLNLVPGSEKGKWRVSIFG